MLKQAMEFIAGFAFALAILGGLAAGCGGRALLQCRVEAVSSLPLEPDDITLGDLRDVARRVKACQAKPDGGP